MSRRTFQCFQCFLFFRVFRGCDASCLHAAHHRGIPPFYYSIILYYQRYPRPYIPSGCVPRIYIVWEWLPSLYTKFWILPALHRVFRLRMCMPSRARGATPDLVLNASLNLTVGGRRCFSYIKVAVSHGKLQLWGFKAETASILLQGFARLVNFCDKSRSVFLSPSYLTSPLSSYFSRTISMIRRNYG